MTRRKCMANIIAVVMVMLISMASLIEELKGAGDKVEIFRIALIPGLWLLVIMFWVAKYLKAPRDTTMYKGKSLASIVGCIMEAVIIFAWIYVAPTQKKIIAAGVVYLVTVLAFYRFYAGVWAPKKGENSRCQS